MLLHLLYKKTTEKREELREEVLKPLLSLQWDSQEQPNVIRA